MPYVSAIRANGVVVLRGEPSVDSAAVGFRTRYTRRGELHISFPNREALPELLMRLRDAGVAFAGAPHGWPPAEIFVDLRDKGLVSGRFDEIVFLAKGQSEIRER